MKLQLTIFAQELKTAGNDSISPFAVVAVLHTSPENKPTVLGKTEVLKNTTDPDFCKIFVLDYDLGSSMKISVTLLDASQNNKKLGQATYNVGSVLGTKGGVVGKALVGGGYLMVHIERSSGMGTLQLQLAGKALQSSQEVVDPYFEFQTKRRVKDKNGDTKQVWDVVFRSMPLMDTTSPEWAPLSLDYGMLLHANKSNTQPKKVRITVKDYDDRDDTTIGSTIVTVPELMEAMKSGSSIAIKHQKQDTGKLIVVSAKITDREEEEEEGVEVSMDRGIYIPPSSTTSRALPTDDDEEEDIDLSAPINNDDDGDIVLMPEAQENPTFADYISGGCQLKVVVAIDYTASNGDPRKEQSLHHFTKDGSKNQYQECIYNVCSILSQYDSDQKYSVYGFGAKKNGTLSHCFPLAENEAEVEGVNGILKAYKDAFKAGIAMSKPTNLCEVIQTAGKDAKASLDTAMKQEQQEYTILTIFTNGNFHDVSETVTALQKVKDTPLSVVVVGVGPSGFGDMAFLKEQETKNRVRVHFVDAKAHSGDDLTATTLSPIPNQLVSYFTSKGISPNPPIEVDEIVIAPATADDGFADVTVGENGEITIENNPANTTDNAEGTDTPASKIPEPMQQYAEQGKKMFLQQAKRQFGRVSKQMTRNMNRMIDRKVNDMFGISNATGGGRRGRKGRR